MIEDTYKYRSVTVAKYIIAYANAHRFSMNMTKLQKLLYITYGTCLAAYKSRLTDEHPQAWPYGPVFPTTRNKLLNVDFETVSLSDDDLTEISNDSETVKLVKVVFDAFGAYNAGTLTSWSHSAGSPWEKTTQMSGFKWGDRISDDIILAYFDRIIIRKQDRDGRA